MSDIRDPKIDFAVRGTSKNSDGLRIYSLELLGSRYEGLTKFEVYSLITFEGHSNRTFAEYPEELARIRGAVRKLSL